MRKILKRIGFSLLHKKYLWTILAFVGIVGFLDPNSFWHRHQIRMQNDELREEITAYRTQYNNDTRELRELQRSPEALERVARVNLYMKTADEDIYVIENETILPITYEADTLLSRRCVTCSGCYASIDLARSGSLCVLARCSDLCSLSYH